MSRYWFRLRRFIAHTVLHTDDSPHVIALGTAIAVLIAFLPLVGFQTAIAVGIAALFRANKAVCIPIVWITNPFTMWPIYYGCFELGRFVLPASSSTGQEGLQRLIEFTKTGNIFHVEYWTELFRLFMGVGAELWVGCMIVGVVGGIMSYFLARSGVVAYRERRRQRQLRRSVFQAKRTAEKIARHGGSAKNM